MTRSDRRTPDRTSVAWDGHSCHRVLATCLLIGLLFTLGGCKRKSKGAAGPAVWTVVQPKTTTRIGVMNHGCHGKGLFVAVGNDGAITTSTDGRDWKPRSKPLFLLFPAHQSRGSTLEAASLAGALRDPQAPPSGGGRGGRAGRAEPDDTFPHNSTVELQGIRAQPYAFPMPFGPKPLPPCRHFAAS